MTELPELPYEAWRATKDTLHLYAQQVGKLKLAYTAPQNHWWNVTFAVDVRGLRTGPMRAGDTVFELAFDFVDHALVARTTSDDVESFLLHDGLSVAAFHRQLVALLARLGVEPAISPKPFGVPMTTPFAEDNEHASYDTVYVERFRDVLAWVDGVLREFAGWSCAKTSPVQLFWHSFDLAVTRFSGRRAPPLSGVDRVTAEAYSHEVISFGFWAGDETTPFAAFYSYTAPEPESLSEHELGEGARWVETGNGHLAQLPYEDVRTAADPREALLRFLQSAYDAGADAAGWPADDLRTAWCPQRTKGVS